MASITFAVQDKTKEEMKSLAWVNWSELTREEAIKQEKRMKLFDELDELTKDSKLTDEDCLKLGRLVKERVWKRLKKEG